ncbi:MAG TPA: hypothetical protein VHC72_14675 [Bryobacteraceae bacterium]|nr:hypothetical protein [Bryobacteraceae bacterium]
MRRLRDVFFCIVLAAASAAGMPMRADEVEELMRAMNQPKVAHTLRKEEQEDDPLIRATSPDRIQ